MIGAILGVANGLLPVNPVKVVQGVIGGLSGGESTRSRAVEAQALRLSPEAQRAGFRPVHGEVDVAAFQAQHEAKLASFRDQLGKIFSENGLSLSGDVKLRYDSAANRLVVDGSHPQQGQIESLLDQFPRLIPAFRQLEAASQFLNAQNQPSDNPSNRQALAAYRDASSSQPYTVAIPAG
jgi:hypothetical protein